VCFIFSLNYRFDSNLNSQIKFESTQGNPNKIQMKIQLITLAKYKPKIIDGAKINLGIQGKKQEVILMCFMSTSSTNQVLEISHFAIKPNLRMLHLWLTVRNRSVVRKIASMTYYYGLIRTGGLFVKAS
jgi:hypothetical protein